MGLSKTLAATFVAASAAAAGAQAQPSSGTVGSWQEREDTTTYKVIINHEEQYSIWWADRELPLGWSEVGKSGTKQECLDYIEEVWTDMRPLSLRKKMCEAQGGTWVDPDKCT